MPMGNDAMFMGDLVLTDDEGSSPALTRVFQYLAANGPRV